MNVTLRWRAFNEAGTQIGDALDVIAGVAPMTRVVSTSAYFGPQIKSCGQISRFEQSQATYRRI